VDESVNKKKKKGNTKNPINSSKQNDEQELKILVKKWRISHDIYKFSRCYFQD